MLTGRWLNVVYPTASSACTRAGENNQVIDKVLRTPKEVVLKPIALYLLRSVHPTIITIAACGVGLAAAAMVWQQHYGIGLGLWLVNRLLDGLDGTVARMYNKQSDLGSYLDVLLDNLVYAAIPLALAVGADTTAGYISVAVLIVSFYLNTVSWMYLAALLERRNAGAVARGEMTTVTMPGGLVEGAETIVFFSLLLLLPGTLVVLCITMALLVFLTIAQRLAWATHHL
jgi:phosphatidylglycerophosphate synthase